MPPIMSKKSPLLLSPYASLGPLCHSHTPSPSHASAVPHHSCRHAHTGPPPHGHDPELLQWPEPVKPHKTPTPYQILNCRQGELYTKQRFHALVKLYHPDCRQASPVAHLPLRVRLDRYRMLIAAHDILSDADKRRAYDTSGHGWAGHHRIPSSYGCDFDRRRWATDPRYNATWEDWERWRQANEGGPENDGRTMQMSNFAFMSLIFAIVGIGGVVQGTRFSAFNNSVIERRDQIHREASTTLRRSQHATIGGDRDERIQSFLDHREAQLAGEASYQRLLSPAQTCAPDPARKQ